MSLAHLDIADRLADGRQSERALNIARGTRRMFRAQGLSTVAELVLANGRRADIVAISAAGEVTIVEIKSCLADFRSDGKWHEYLPFCDRFFFAVDPDFDQQVIPDDAGIILADQYGGEFVRKRQKDRLASARRRSILVSFAKLAADRLHDLADPAHRLP